MAAPPHYRRPAAERALRPALILIKPGVVLPILAAAYLWTEYGSSGGWSWLRQLGTTSLLVYWVHIEMVYGRMFGSWKESLSTAETVAMAVAVPVALDYYFSTARRVSGD